MKTIKMPEYTVLTEKQVKVVDRFIYCAENLQRIARSSIAQSMAVDQSLLSQQEKHDCLMITAMLMDLANG